MKKRISNIGLYRITEINKKSEDIEIEEIEIYFDKKWIKFYPNIKNESEEKLKQKL